MEVTSDLEKILWRVVDKVLADTIENERGGRRWIQARDDGSLI